MKLSKKNQKTFVVRVVSRVVLPTVNDKMQKIALGAVTGVATSPAANRLVDTITKEYMETAHKYGIVDDAGALDLSLAKAAMRGAFDMMEGISIEDFPKAPRLLHTLFKDVELVKEDVDVMMQIAHELTEKPSAPKNNTQHNMEGESHA